MAQSVPFFESHTLAQIKGMVTSYLRGGNRRTSTLPQIDGLVCRARDNRIAPAKITSAVLEGVLASPNRFSKKAEDLKRRFAEA